jgi:hypothetical protein
MGVIDDLENDAANGPGLTPDVLEELQPPAEDPAESEPEQPDRAPHEPSAPQPTADHSSEQSADKIRLSLGE